MTGSPGIFVTLDRNEICKVKTIGRHAPKYKQINRKRLQMAEV